MRSFGAASGDWSRDHRQRSWEQMTAGAKQDAAYVYELTLPPNAPSNVNAALNVTGKGKNTAYNDFITWADNSNNESGFLVQRYVKMGNK